MFLISFIVIFFVVVSEQDNCTLPYGFHLTKEDRKSRWYFGGLASAGAACCTHPLDLIKVHLQTQQEGRLKLAGMAAKIWRSDGFLGFYNGLSASLVRQLTYSTTRFGMYETLKKQFPDDRGPIPFYQKIFLAAVSGGCGGFIGTPGDMINVRMQNDIKLPLEKRRNYKHAIDGLIRVSREEGMTKLFNGAVMATSRAILMTIGQSGVATIITQPFDVLKTRMMNAKPGEFKGIIDCCMYTAKMGLGSFYKGFIPAFVRLAPQTVLTFIFFEQLRMNFGYFTIADKKE